MFGFPFKTALFFFATFLLLSAVAQPSRGSKPKTSCSSNVISHEISSPPGADETTCQSFRNGNTYKYPEDFTYLNAFVIWKCPNSKKRIIVSNGVTDHSVTQGNPNPMCRVPWWLEIPIEPVLSNTLTEPASHGIVAMALNGIPAFGAQEASGDNAYEHAEDAFIKDAKYWYGHASPNYDWHYHSPHMGKEAIAAPTTMVGYALDGFPIYGPVANQSTLDSCNGRMVNGSYRYHLRTAAQVQGGGVHEGDSGGVGYCNPSDPTSPAIQWRYVIGCYRGSLKNTIQGDCSTMSLPSDCVVESSNNEDMIWKDGKCQVSTKAALKWWGWLLIGLGIAIALLAGFCFYRKKKKAKQAKAIEVKDMV